MSSLDEVGGAAALAAAGRARTAGAVVPAALRAEGLTRRYGRTIALDRVDLAVPGGIVGLLGPNGAGKTTLLSIVATVASPDSGRLSVLGYDPAEAAERLAIRRRLGYLPQDLGYHRHFTVAAFLDYVAILKEITDPRRRHLEVCRVLSAVGLETKARQRIRTTVRRHAVGALGLAQALLDEPDLLVLDEVRRRSCWIPSSGCGSGSCCPPPAG